MKGNGYTKAGVKRWRCRSCGSSKTRRIDNSAKLLRLFLSWLLSKRSIAELGCSRLRYTMHTEEPKSPAEILRCMPRDEDVDGLFAIASNEGQRSDGRPERYGRGIDWNEFHMPTRYRQ